MTEQDLIDGYFLLEGIWQAQNMTTWEKICAAYFLGHNKRHSNPHNVKSVTNSREELIEELLQRMLLYGIKSGKPKTHLWYGNFQFAMNEDCTDFDKKFPIRYITSLDELGREYTLRKCPTKYIRKTLMDNSKFQK